MPRRSRLLIVISGESLRLVVFSLCFQRVRGHFQRRKLFRYFTGDRRQRAPESKSSTRVSDVTVRKFRAKRSCRYSDFAFLSCGVCVGDCRSWVLVFVQESFWKSDFRLIRVRGIRKFVVEWNRNVIGYAK